MITFLVWYQAVYETGPLCSQLPRDTGPLAQFDDLGGVGLEPSEETRIGAQGIDQGEGIAAVILGTGWREAVPQAVKLLRVERMDGEAALIMASTTGPCGISMATPTASAVAPVRARIHAAIARRPAPPCGKLRLSRH